MFSSLSPQELKKIAHAISLSLAVVLSLGTAALGHSGRTDSDGCHTDRSTGDYHCHNEGTGSSGGSGSSGSGSTRPLNSPGNIIILPDPDTVEKPYYDIPEERILLRASVTRHLREGMVIQQGESQAIARLGCIESPNEVNQLLFASRLSRIIPSNTPVAFLILGEREGEFLVEVFDPSLTRSFNLQLVEDGIAQVDPETVQSCIEPDKYFEAERQAQNQGIGIWGISD